MAKQPVFSMAIAFATGIAIQDLLNLAVPWLLAGFFLTLIFILLSLKINFLRISKLLICAFLFVSTGAFLHQINSPVLNKKISDGDTGLIFKITSKLKSSETKRKYEILAWQNSTAVPAVLSVDKKLLPLDFNYYYQSNLYMRKIPAPTAAYQFDYQKYEQRKGIFHQAFANEKIFVSENRNDLSFTEKIKQKRLQILSKIDMASMSKDSREFLKGIILADRTDMGAEVVSDFTKTGLVHFLAISGSHLALFFAVVIFILNKIIPRRYYQYTVVAALLVIWSYGFFIDFGSSVLRSCVMITVYYIFLALARKPDLLHSLGLAALIILFIDTQQLFDVGFQLSFVAVFGIYWLNEPILKLLPLPKSLLMTTVLSAVSMTLAAQIVTLAFVLYYFHQFSLMSIFANFIVVPLSGIVLSLSLLMAVLIAVDIKIDLIFKCYDLVVHFLLKLIHWFAGFDKYYFNNIPMTFWEALALFLAVYLLRPVLQRVSFTNIFRFSVMVLAFFALRFSLNLIANQKNLAEVHDYSKSKIFSAKIGRTIHFYVSEKVAADQNFHKFVVRPYLTYTRSRNYQIHSVDPAAQSVVFQNKIYPLK